MEEKREKLLVCGVALWMMSSLIDFTTMQVSSGHVTTTQAPLHSERKCRKAHHMMLQHSPRFLVLGKHFPASPSGRWTSCGAGKR